MFRLEAPPDYPWTVTVELPNPCMPGKTTKHTFTAKFRHLTLDEIAQWRAQEADDPLALLRAVLVGWGDDLVDEDDNPIPFSEPVREQLLGWPRIAEGVAAAWAASTQPTAVEARAQGNLRPSPARGRRVN